MVVIVQISRGHLKALGDVAVDVSTNIRLFGVDHARDGAAWVGFVVPVIRKDDTVLGGLTDVRHAVSVIKE